MYIPGYQTFSDSYSVTIEYLYTTVTQQTLQYIYCTCYAKIYCNVQYINIFLSHSVLYCSIKYRNTLTVDTIFGKNLSLHVHMTDGSFHMSVYSTN